MADGLMTLVDEKNLNRVLTFGKGGLGLEGRGHNRLIPVTSTPK